MKHKLKRNNEMAARKNKKKDKIYIPEIIDLINCSNPSIFELKEFNCIATLNARKIVKKMINSFSDCKSHKNKKKHYFGHYFNCWG